MLSATAHAALQSRVHAIIPARYASTRFPGKPLTLLHNKPMFWHVWSRAGRCPLLCSVTLATDDERIKEAAEALAVPVLMTGSHHRSGTDRVYEAARLLNLPDNAIIINIQGDEPALELEPLTRLAGAFVDPGVQAATLAHPLDPADMLCPDKVKVVVAANGDALYFSRAGIPFCRDGERVLPVYGHIGMYAFTMQTLQRFVALPPSPLERTEKLEQLRLLENNIPMRVLITDTCSVGVDHVEDVARVLPLLDNQFEGA